MKKKIAVVVRERQAEALRMAIGLTLADDEVTVFVVDYRLADDALITLNLEMLEELGVKVFSNNAENRVDLMPKEDIAGRMAAYDSVIPY